MDTQTSNTGDLSGLSALGAAAETLWARIAPVPTQGKRRTILFVGAQHGVGTSTLAACAAAGLARNLKAQVLLLELGVDSSSLAPLLGLPAGPGFQEILCSAVAPESCIRGCGLDGLGVVTAGRGKLPPGQLATEQASRALERLGSGRDFLLIDAPPILEHPELTPILQHVDEAVLVLEAERTSREQARELVELVSRAGVRILGSVLNRTRPSLFS